MSDAPDDSSFEGDSDLSEFANSDFEAGASLKPKDPVEGDQRLRDFREDPDSPPWLDGEEIVMRIGEHMLVYLWFTAPTEHESVPLSCASYVPNRFPSRGTINLHRLDLGSQWLKEPNSARTGIFKYDAATRKLGWVRDEDENNGVLATKVFAGKLAELEKEYAETAKGHMIRDSDPGTIIFTIEYQQSGRVYTITS